MLFGATGGPEFDALPREAEISGNLLAIRKHMAVYANLRPIVAYDELSDVTSLKTSVVQNVDLVVVRELNGGIYFGEPRGIEPIENNERKGVNTHTYTSSESSRVARVAFDLAKKRSNKLTSVEKANVMESGQMWREDMQALRDREFSEIPIHHMYADNAAMQLVRQPKQFDVLVTTNLFGDILSDIAAMLTGSLGMLPSASLGAADATGRRLALYEPVHGSAPDIAGQGKANPIAMLLSFAMALRYSFDLSEDANLIEAGVAKTLDAGLRTDDIMQNGMDWKKF